jgi:hypothetical protein
MQVVRHAGGVDEVDVCSTCSPSNDASKPTSLCVNCKSSMSISRTICLRTLLSNRMRSLGAVALSVGCSGSGSCWWLHADVRQSQRAATLLGGIWDTHWEICMRDGDILLG